MANKEKQLKRATPERAKIFVRGIVIVGDESERMKKQELLSTPRERCGLGFAIMRVTSFEFSFLTSEDYTLQ
jgi:hypothetical protein